MMDIKKSAELIKKAIEDKKGYDIVEIEVSEKTILADLFIIASGKSTVQVRAIAEGVEEKLDKEGLSPVRREGINEGRWAVLDYGDIIVHIFNDESRLFYHLERLWQGEKRN